jgi:nucleotide-binding universal stress UspA family protein
MSVFHRILVAFDGSHDSYAALALAGELALDQGARMTLLTVVPDIPGTVANVAVGPVDIERDYQELQCVARDTVPGGVPLTTILRHGSPAHHIIEVAAEHDLVVMGTHGRGRLGEALVGSVSRDVVHSRRGAVLLARAPHPS